MNNGLIPVICDTCGKPILDHKNMNAKRHRGECQKEYNRAWNREYKRRRKEEAERLAVVSV